MPRRRVIVNGVKINCKPSSELKLAWRYAEAQRDCKRSLK